MKSLHGLLLLLSLCLPAARALALEFTSMEPGYGAPGDSITLNGAGFDPMAAHEVTVDGVTAVVEEVQAGFLRFTIPVGAKTGPVEVTLDMETFAYRSHLTITKPITVTLDPALPAYTDDYLVGTLYDEDEPPGPNFTVPVVDGETTLVTAAGADSEPGLLGIATGLDASLQLSAQSSAIAIVFMVPQVFTIEPVDAQQALAVLAGLPEVQLLADLIADEILAASDYFAGDTIDAALLAAVVAYLDTLPPPPQPLNTADSPQGGPPPIQDDFIDGIQNFAVNYPRDLAVMGYEALNRLEASALPLVVSRTGMPTHGIKMDHAPLDELNDLIEEETGFNLDLEGSALEWLAVVYELDPADPALDSKAKVDMLAGSHTAIYDRARPDPVSKRLISAKPVSNYADFLGNVVDMAFGKLFPVFASDKDVRIAADRSGLYIVRSFSGARFPPQASLIDSSGLPGGQSEHVRMLVLNLIMAANEAAGTVLKSQDIIGDRKVAEILDKLYAALGTAIDKQIAVGDIDGSFLWTLFHESAKLLAKELTSAVIKKSLESGLSAATGKLMAKSLLKGLNVPGKVVSGIKAVERVAALSNAINYIKPNTAWMGQSVQSTVAVIGNPWRPEITSFTPRQGHRGRIVWINGRRFSPVAADNIVLFGSLSTDPEDPPEPEQAEVLEASGNTLKVRVPEDAMTGAITVAIQDHGFFSTAALAPPNHEFVVLERPVITAIDPDPPPAGGFARLVGNHFSSVYGVLPGENIVKFASQGGASTPVEIATPTSILVRIPDNGNPNSVTVQTEGCPPEIIAQCTSDPFAFTAALPPVGTAGGGILITTNGDGNVADGDISLHEAMLIAAGTLGRALTEPPNPRPPGVTYESDFASLATSGASKRDFIHPHASFPGGPIVLAQALPPLENFDRYELPDIVIDGTAVAGPALVANGKSGITFTQSGNSVTTFQNFGGHGLHLSGGASGNEFFRLIFDNCGGEGVFLDTATSGNFIVASTSNSDLNGLRLSGAGVEANEIQTVLFPGSTSLVFPNDGNEGFGVLLEAGANGNVLRLGHTRNNTLGGIRLTGTGTEHNKIAGGEANPAEIFDNGGLGVVHDRPGVWIDVPNSYVRNLNVAGNNGDGVLVEGAGTHGVKLEWIFAGYVYATHGFPAGSAKANQGNGVHFRNGTHDNDARQLYLGANMEHGVLIAGADVYAINILSGDIGRGYYFNGMQNLFANLPNLKSGIAVMGGAHDNVIGYPIPLTFLSSETVRVMNHQADAPDSGAGILLSGMNTAGNVVLGSVIGSDGLNLANVGNRYGIRITDGAHANIIGLRGEPGTSAQPTKFATHNLFQNNTVAGILLESGGSLPGGTSTGEPQTPVGGNVIQNNHFGHTIDVIQVTRPNRVGVLIRQGGVANRIGGSQPGETNYFWDNSRAGLEIESAVITRPDLANRIVGNVFQNQGSREPPVADPLAGSPVGAAVLISGGASGHIIGGVNPGEANRMVAGVDPHPAPDGNLAGVYIDASSNNEVIGNQIGTDTLDGGNVFAGVIIRNGTGNVIGPGNRIGSNGDPFTAGTLGGVAISGGSGNMVIGNRIGPAPDENFNPNDPAAQRNRNGVLIRNSSGNLIGDQGAERANTIVGATTAGVRIEGAGSTGNHVANNLIGISNMGEAWLTGNGVTAATHAGVVLTGGASNNIIGGERPVPIGAAFATLPAGNTIRQNRGDGVRVEAASLGNSITWNVISEHAGRPGIQNTGGGNGELAPPANLAFNGLEVSGTVNGATVPNGSTVQIFSDPDDEGWQFLAQAEVVAAAFTAPVGMMNHARICATVTHATNGNTSEFSCFTPMISPAFDIRRAEEPPQAIEVAPGDDRAVAVIKLTTQDFAARVESMTFDASGSADETTALTGVSLYLDADDNGFLSAVDQLLAGPVPVPMNDGAAAFADMDASIPSGAVQRWLLVVSVDAGATLGQTLEFTLASNSEVDSTSLLPAAPIIESGNFPLVSDLATIAIGGPPTGDEIQQAILSGTGFDPDMDINGDGQIDVADVVAAEQQ